MEYVSVIVSEDAAHSCIRELGQMGCVQFTDLNPELTPFQRRYVAYIKRCDEIERKIRYINGEVVKLGVPVQGAGSVDHFVDNQLSKSDSVSASSLLEGLEGKLDQYEQQLIDLNKYNNKLTEEYNGKVELNHVLIKARTAFMSEVSNLGDNDSSHDRFEKSALAMVEAPLMPGAGAYQGDDMSFTNIAGVLPASDKDHFERMLFRSTRGNCYVRFADIEEPLVDATGQKVSKVVFIIFFKSTAIEAKVKRICDAFSAHRYEVKKLDRPRELQIQQDANQRELEDSKKILDKNTETRVRICVEVAQYLEEWLWTVRREKATYHTLNLFRSDVGNFLRGQGWILKDSLGKARSALDRAQATLNLPPTSMIERVMEVWPTPPTHFKTNKFTDAYQEFVNTYGIPRYREINPALFTAATFPFLFGVMYGDVGHGSCLTIAALYLILTEKKAEDRSLDEMMKGIYSARYMLFMMGVYAVYCGFIYNDYFSIALKLFDTNYEYEEHEANVEATRLSDYGDSSKVYPFGVDPAWHISDNELLFFNSMKMKMSVVLGIIQMSFGICLKGLNALYFHSYLDFFCEFLPMILFDVGFFGYMVILIFIKWSINWDERMQKGSCNYDVNGKAAACQLDNTNLECYSYSGEVCNKDTEVVDLCPLDYGGTGDGCQPPNLITTLINIALAPGSVDEPMYEGQAGIQTFLLLMAFFCVPWLLCVKPLYLKFTHKPAAPAHGGGTNPLLDAEDGASDNSATAIQADHGHGHGHGEFDFGEIFIHQAIETIEFVLGMVSNTASYLRLWALSLAHSELSTVFWEKALLSMINTGNPVMVYAGYAVFACVTFAVLLCMDLLECFLHALRLHWVEFQSKFFKADGYRFQPFDFKSVLARASLD
jgi:V-type H+-transporting ATPase subunit a